MHLPWSDRVSSKKLLEEEIVRQLVIMKTSSPESKEYQEALKSYNQLHNHSLKEKTIVEHKKTRWFEGATTGLLATAVLTAESWTPLTSKWWSSITRPFKTKGDDVNLRFGDKPGE